ncbi:MAG: PilZ domain-containing protein [Pseudomonadota bacterium]
MKVKADISKNRLYLVIAGQVVKEEMDKLYTDVRFCVADLKPGFDVISDLSECNILHLSGVPTFRKIMNFLITKEVGDVVRIINRKSLIFKQILNLSSRICGYKPIYVSTLEEAEEKLEKSIKRNGIRFHINHLPAEYIANEITGKGNILDLSITGCAIESATLPVSAHDEISIKIVFQQQDIPSEEFIVKSRVVRIQGDNIFAVEFKDLDEEIKNRLWKCLICEAQREI